MSDKKKKGDDPTYSEASGELEQILQDIESGEIDLDVLTDKVERAATLLAFCRQKLAATETKVKKITAELAASAESADAEATENDE
ncbi:MAG: exodeoxyribonuclease VII small subunit [Planctomycetes bacterium]|jgi:exodeoxyribonuclease VII small subunit|nr:exodeoxyribonuclease VII small subunit [Planctomycetota bacterium]MCC7063184.1 exodeoxyribonuclease VII small subunit [Planctomycetota bacterium]